MNCRSDWQDSAHPAFWGVPEGADPGQTLSVHSKGGNLPLSLAATCPDGGDPAESQVLCQGKAGDWQSQPAQAECAGSCSHHPAVSGGAAWSAVPFLGQSLP